MFSLYIVNRMMGMLGIIFFRTDAASTPLISGIEMSSKITSGLRTFALSTASRPSAASPQTSRSVRCLRKALIMRLTVLLSSAMNTCFGKVSP